MRLRIFFGLSSAAVVWIGCNAILGNESATFTPPASEAGVPPPSTITPGANDSGPIDAGACAEIDLDTDPHNCGACFHDCFGGGCKAGICQPTLLISDNRAPGALALDDNFVYWADVDGGDLNRAPIDGGAIEKMFHPAAPEHPGDDIAIDNGRIYFAHQQGDAGVVSCPVSGCGVGPTQVIDNNATVNSVAVENGNVFFAETGGGIVGRCALPCTNGAFETVSAAATFPLRVTGATNIVAWTVLSDHAVHIRNNGTLFTVPTNPLPTGLTIAKGAVYTAVKNDGPVAVGLDGGPPRNLWDGGTLSQSNEIFVDTELHFSDEKGGKVVTCPIAGCDATSVIYTGEKSPRAITGNATFLYWTRDDGIARVVR